MNYQQQFSPRFQQPYANGYTATPPMMDNLSQMRAPYVQQPTQQSGVIWVQGEEGAKAYMVAAGNSVLLLDSENSAFYIKSTDQSGMPLPLRVFDYTERTQPTKAAPTAQAAPAVEYVTRAEFEAAIERLTPQRRTRKAQTEEANADE